MKREIYLHNGDKPIIMNIQSISKSISILYFTNDLNEHITIPSGLVLYEYDFSNNTKIILKPIGDNFILCWTDNYTVEVDNKYFFDIKNERQWNIAIAYEKL
jgi:hypothetical protein